MRTLVFLFLLALAMHFHGCARKSTTTLWMVTVPDTDSVYHEIYIDRDKFIYYSDYWVDILYDKELADTASWFDDYMEFREKYFECTSISKQKNVIDSIIHLFSIEKNFDGKKYVISPVNDSIFPDDYNIEKKGKAVAYDLDFWYFANRRANVFKGKANENFSPNDNEEMILIREDTLPTILRKDSI